MPTILAYHPSFIGLGERAVAEKQRYKPIYLGRSTVCIVIIIIRTRELNFAAGLSFELGQQSRAREKGKKKGGGGGGESGKQVSVALQLLSGGVAAQPFVFAAPEPWLSLQKTANNFSHFGHRRLLY